MDNATPSSPVHVAKPLRLEPFRALMLAPGRVGDPSSAQAFARPYRAVAARMRSWEAKGRIQRASAPGLFVHEYSVSGLSVRGIVGAIELDRRTDEPDQRAVWPHEATHVQQVDELAARMREMGINPAPILLVHEGPARVRAILDDITANPPDQQFRDRADQHHRIWPITESAVIDQINAALQHSSVLVADGHHRYAAYRRLQEELPGTAWDRGLAMLVDQLDTPLFLGAIHRTLGAVSLAEGERAATEAGAQTRRTSREQALAELGPATLVFTDGRGWSVVTTPGPELAQVQWLQSQFVAEIPQQPTTVSYHHAADAAIRRANRGCLGVLLPAPAFETVRSVVERGGLLPEKATSFQPKPTPGVIMRSLRDESDERR